jgi:predicted dehydrogenase
MGAANIARKNVSAICHSSSACEMVAIASRSAQKAESLVQNHVHSKDKQKQILIFSGENAYHDLLQNDMVDAVYIPLPTSLKMEWARKALMAGKHVLCEKPVATSASKYEQVIDLAKSKGKYIMDGAMFVHNIRTHHLLDFISHKHVFGDVTRIDASFTFLGDETFLSNDIRCCKDFDFHGCLGDLGWYCIQFAILVFRKVGYSMVKSAQVTHCVKNKDQVPIDVTCLVTFGSVDGSKGIDKILSFHSSFCQSLKQRFEISGSKKSLVMEDAVLPKNGSVAYQVKSQELTYMDQFSVQETDVCEMPMGPVQEVLMWRNFSKFCADENKWKDPNTKNISFVSLETQRVLDALMKSIEENNAMIDMVDFIQR